MRAGGRVGGKQREMEERKRMMMIIFFSYNLPRNMIFNDINVETTPTKYHKAYTKKVNLK